MRFSKYHGTRNDFVLIEDLDGATPLSSELVAAVCDRHGGVGADGVIRIVRGAAAAATGLCGQDQTDADFFMDYANADGETAEMCGNGIRCLGMFVYERGLTSKTELAVGTRGGRKHLWLDVDGRAVRQVTVDMGQPSLNMGSLPMTGEPDATFLQQPFQAGGRTWMASAVSMGNPHMVLFLERAEDLDALDVTALGAGIERSPRFPQRTNVEFVQVVDDGEVRMRVWERGSGLTQACGTGACAVLVATALAGRTGREADVLVPGGRLRVAWRQDGHVLLTGPATWVFDGELSAAWLTERAVGAPGGPAAFHGEGP
jgi:diaminopimelate epimerase